MQKNNDKYAKEALETAVKDSSNLTQVMKKLGMSTRSGRLHAALKKRIQNYNIDISHFTRERKNKYTREALEAAVKDSTSVFQVMKKVNAPTSSGGSHALVSEKIRKYGLDTSHFLGQASTRNKPSSNRRSPESILILSVNTARRTQAVSLRRALISIGVAYVCAFCNCADIWNGKKITLQVDHINGNPYDNRKENLRFLCPNCHSQTSTWGKTRRY